MQIYKKDPHCNKSYILFFSLFLCFSYILFSVREEDLVMALKMTPRDIHRICGKLKEDRLLKMCVL